MPFAAYVEGAVGVAAGLLADGEDLADYRFVFARVLATVNKTIYDDMRRMESLVRSSECDWTVIRPAGLYAADHVTPYRRPAGHGPGVSTSVPDLADALVRSATDHRDAGDTIQVLTDQGAPPYLLLLARQASLHRT